jgi:hypothetical protein
MSGRTLVVLGAPAHRALAVVIALVGACAAKTGGSVDVSESDIAALPAAPSTGRFALGVNEGISVPKGARKGRSGNQLASLLAADAVLLRDLGASLVRAHTGNFPTISCMDWVDRRSVRDDMDAWVAALGTSLEGVGMVSPWPGNATGAYTDHYLPDDMAAYRDCVQAIVERYDGDGVDDMPGLPKKIRYWEVDNEPDLKHTNEAAGAERDYDPATFAYPEEYAEVLIQSAKAIRAADKSATILAFGLYRPHANSGHDYLEAALKVSGVSKSFDILSLHTYHDDDGERLADGIEASRLLVPDKPVWVTEASVTAGDDEEEQGRRVAAQVAHAAAAGAERFFWHTLADPPAREGRSHAHVSTNSLLRSSGGATEDKPAAAVYRNLAAQLTSHDLVGCTLSGDNAVKLKDGSTLLFAGTATASAGGVSLRTGKSIANGATATAPAMLWK